MHPGNPSEIRGITSKGQQAHQTAAGSDSVDRVFKLAAQQRRINNLAMPSKQQKRWQMTASQEIGWYADPLVPKNEMQQKGLKNTAITQYVADYVLQTSINPYHRDVHLKR